MSSGNHRIIYQQHFGHIPLDHSGRTYDIHHWDGNHKNNDPSNLIAVPIGIHFMIHYIKGELGACHAIALRMKHSSKLISEIMKVENKRRVTNGTHHFLGSKNPQHKMVLEGIHPFLGNKFKRTNNNLIRLKNGNHPSQIKKTCPICQKLVDSANYGRWHGKNCNIQWKHSNTTKEKISQSVKKSKSMKPSHISFST